MTINLIINIISIVLLTIISGIGDAQGFVHGAAVWNNGKVVWVEVLKSTLGFIAGITPYWLSIKFLNADGITSPEIITLLWFVITIVGVAITSGKFFQWQRVDQIIGIGILVGVTWLLFRTSG